MNANTENYLAMYQSSQEYLQLSRVYADYLGGLRWSGTEEALILADGRFFAFSEAIAEFVDGFASAGRVIPFGYLLHWMDLLQNQRQLDVPTIQLLKSIFDDTGDHWRFAGAFAARLSSNVPEVAVPPDLEAVGKRLRNRAFPIRWFTSQFHETQDPPRQPPIPPEAFERDILAKLAAYSEEDLCDWLQTGRGPIRGAERLVQEHRSGLGRLLGLVRGHAVGGLAERPLPPSLARVLTALVERPRLTGAQTYVTQLVGALVLPPRRFSPQELPVGGYADIETRGQVEHLLPTQFALDEMEFLRRFAEKELLYFRREEPPAQNRQELVVLLDQGVRTWGDVRLVLSAAALAYGKQAILRKTPIYLATTSNGGNIVHPLEADAEALGQLVEASDLSLNPGLALEMVLETPSESLRDVVLLTHPRSLRESDVLAAARRLGTRDRLFAVALDAHGHVEVSEVRHGTPIRVRQFHIDFVASQPTPRRPPPSSTAPGPMWTGDVEAIPFPFRLGTEPHITHFDFDFDGQWLLTASGQGTLHLWKLDGSAMEMLPRPCGKSIPRIIDVRGVAGGFVVIHQYSDQLAIAHYDVVRRHCTLYDQIGNGVVRANSVYVPEDHTLVITCEPGDPRLAYLIELDTETVYASPPGSELPARACLAWSKAVSGKFLNPHQRLGSRLNSASGTLVIHGTEISWGPYTPLTDGKPSFQYASIFSVWRAGDTIAVHAGRMDIGESITVLQAPDAAILREYPIVRPKHKIVRHLLSFDGSRIALQRSDDRIEVDAVHDRSAPAFCTRAGGFTRNIQFFVGKHCLFLNLGSNRQFWHRFDWASGQLEHKYERMPMGRTPSLEQTRTSYFGRCESYGPITPGSAGMLPACCVQDRERYVSGLKQPMWFVLDCFGQVAVLDLNENLLAMFIAFRDRFAAWMPDGTRIGSLTLSLGSTTPGAAIFIAHKLLGAEKEGQS